MYKVDYLLCKDKHYVWKDEVLIKAPIIVMYLKDKTRPGHFDGVCKLF